jgi:hypothetical protein
MRLTIEDPNAEKLQGFRYWWLKKVTGFSPSTHCASCLRGTYLPNLGATFPANTPYDALIHPEAVLYLCGVATPYRHERNFHLAMRRRVGGIVERTLYTGQRLIVEDVEEIPFNDEAARRLFPERGEKFLTCRNFQFAAQHFAK